MGWIDDSLVWVGWDGSTVVWRRAYQESPERLVIEGTAPIELDRTWADAVLGAAAPLPPLLDPTLSAISNRRPGLRGFAAGSLFDGLIGSLVGQSISVAAAAMTEQRLAALFHPGVELHGRRFWPLPTAPQLATANPSLVRKSGVTWRRAHALVKAGQEEVIGRLPDRLAALADPDRVRVLLRNRELVGPWTAESTLLWGIGEPNAYPTGDAALLRAARIAYERPSLNGRDLDALARGWHPYRGWAARLLWTDHFGPCRDGD